MSEIKFTTDGKKVVVIGDLNQTDKIVQEIFITKEGDEIPQGERFIAKNLLDAPLKSYKETELEKLESRYDKEKKEWDSKIERIIKEKSLIYDALSARVKWLKNIAKEPRDNEFKRVINAIADFISNTEKWVFVCNYSEWHFEQYNEDGCNNILERYESSYGRTKFDSMRLLSLFGKPDGSLEFRVNDYSDGSGSDKDVHFFKSKEDGLIFLQNKLDSIIKYSIYDIKNAEKFNLKLDESKLKVYNDDVNESIKKQIIDFENKINDLKEKLN